MKIYDCFAFYNEFQMLELRLKELYDHVDYFVITEANTTHSGLPKEYQLLDNWERIKPWADKIIHVKVEDMPGVINGDCWYNERHQRNCAVRGLKNCTAEDIIMVSDCDEIPRNTIFEIVRKDHSHDSWGLKMTMFNYKYNYHITNPLHYYVPTCVVRASKATRFENFSNMKFQYGNFWPNLPHDYDNGHEVAIQHGGWHFSSIGDDAYVSNKLRSFAHSEAAGLADSVNLAELIAQGKNNLQPNATFEPVIIDNYFPKTILENIDQYKDFILEGGVHTVAENLSSTGIGFNL
jgi:Glycosyltransferase family 17